MCLLTLSNSFAYGFQNSDSRQRQIQRTRAGELIDTADEDPGFFK